MAYTHAKDYLIELAAESSTHGWMKDLIVKVITSNGNLTEDDISASANQLKVNGANILQMQGASASNSNAEIRFKELTHKQGVCALAKDQTIRFSDQVTLLYGNNGSGKSSYFRILNEMVGGNRRTEIRPNIYSIVPIPIDIDLKYTENGSEKTIHWDGTERAIAPLNLSSVFDTEYTKAFLDKRSADTAIVYPYGLHLFSAMTSAMDRIKDRLTAEKDCIVLSLPTIDTENLSDDVIRVLTQRNYRNAQKTYIESRYIISEEQERKRIEIEGQIKALRETNFDDKIKIANNELSLLKHLLDFLTKTKDAINNIVIQWRELCPKIKSAREENEQSKAKISILGEIGNTDSDNWKEFVQAGEKYVVEQKFPEEVCPYCRQPLSDNAQQILKAYGLFLSDKSQSVLETVVKQKRQIGETVSRLNVNFDLSEQLKCLIATYSETSPELEKDITDVVKSFTQIKEFLSQSIMQEIVNEQEIPEIVVNTIAVIDKLCKAKTNSINELTEKKTQKDTRLNQLICEAKPLRENKRISEQKGMFEEWFAKMQNIAELDKCTRELSTRSISILAKTASQTLITDNLKTKFQEELNALKLNHLQVSLSDEGASRGQSFVKIHLVNNNAVHGILSEGEQKGVALALFIAERRMQLSSNPIILDDPVNSLDHYITASLMERLIQLGNQIIIFSHNILLQTSLVGLSGLHVCGSNQRSSCNKTTQHLFVYNVVSLGRDKKGIISEWKQDNVANNLLKAEKLLQDEHYEMDSVSACLRRAIEMMIDEKIFKGLSPLKYHGKKENIQWDQLKTLHADSEMIDSLKAMYGRLSGGELHLGIEHNENPLSFEELEEMCNKLKSL